MNIPRLVIAAPNSGSGKTTIATGIMGALRERGIQVQPYKVGPDYIDPSYHRVAAGRPSRNLDLWMMGREGAENSFFRTAPEGDIAVIEGVMGLFDGAHGTEGAASTAEVAKLFRAPVILVLDVRSAARSVVAWVLGCQAMDPELKIAGIILNNVGSERHSEMLVDALREFNAPPVIGSIPRGAYPSLPSRHLGLVPTVEDTGLQQSTLELARITENYVDIDTLIKIAREAVPLPFETSSAPEVLLLDRKPFVRQAGVDSLNADTGSKVPIAIAMDKAFSFYYQDNLDFLREAGAELVPFSPLTDTEIPAGIAGLYLGGGFPEIYLEELSANESLKREIYDRGKAGMPIWAECGGFMYLCRSVREGAGLELPMVGLVPGACHMEKKLVGLGYVEAVPRNNNIIAQEAQPLRGHEFHYSRFVPDADAFPWAFTFRKNGREWPDGFCSGQILGTYLHFHMAACPDAARRFVEVCRRYLLEKGR